MADWAFVIDDHAGNAIVPLIEATSIRLAFKRNRTPEMMFAAHLESEEACAITTAIANGLPRLRAYRDGTLRFYGRWAPMMEHAQATGEGIGGEHLQAAFRGPGHMLASRFTAASVTFTATDAGQIAWSLINTANGDSDTGIRQGTIAATQTRDRTYEHKQVLEAIQQLTEVQGGLDYEIVPTLDQGVDVLGEFDVFASQGQDKSSTVTFDFGPDTTGTLRAIRRAWQMPVNGARVLGKDGLVGEATDSGSIAKYGGWAVLEQHTDVSEQATLDDKATALLRPDPVEIVTFEPEPTIAPMPWTDYWLGDTVGVRSRYGSLDFERTARINGITVTIDTNGHEDTHELEFEAAI